MGTLLQQLASLSTGGKFAFAALGILLIHGVFRLLETTLPRHFRQADARYRVRKFVVFLGYGVGLLFLVAAFGTAWGGSASRWVWPGLVSWWPCRTWWLASAAGSRLALRNCTASVTESGLATPKADVIDISILRTTVLETGNWVSGDLHNGRLARIPNSLVLKGPVFNYTQGFRFVWDEIKVTLTPQRDHRFARAMLLNIAQETVADFMEDALAHLEGRQRRLPDRESWP